MEMIIKSVEEIECDVKAMLAQADGYWREVDIAITDNFSMEDTHTVEGQLDDAVCSLIAANSDMWRLREEIEKLLEKLYTLIDNVEYEMVAKEIRK